MAVQIQLRRGTAAQWTSANPTLASGEVGVETDTNKQKIGDGTTAWTSLAYFNVNGISFGTTGLTPSTSTAGNVTVAGTLNVANGGTGLTTIPAGNVVIGNGTSALYGVSPGTAGNVLTSIGGVWTSNAAVGGSGSPGGNPGQIQFNNSGAFGGDANLTFSGSTTTAANLIVSNLTVSQAVFSSATKQLVSNPITGTGSVVMNASPIITSPSLITPALGSPTSGNMAATTSIPVANATGTLAVANGGTGLTSTPANGALDIGNGTNFTRTTLTAGTNVTITNGAGSITIAASGGASAATPTALGTVYGSTPAGTEVALGYQAAATTPTGTNVTAVGYQALNANTGNSGTAVGYRALQSQTTGDSNTAVGIDAGRLLTTAGYCTFIGNGAGDTCTGGSNTLIGRAAGNGLTSGSSNIYIGPIAAPSSATITNEIVIATNGSGGKGTTTGFFTAGAGGMYQGNNSAAWSVTSDQRLKKNIVDNNVGLDAINAIRVRNFEYRLPEEVDPELKPTDAVEKPGVQLGVIAQELQAVLPDCVKQESTGVLSVDSDPLTWHMINAIKQLSAALDAANARIAALEAK